MIEFHNIILWNRKQTEFYYSTRFPFSATQLNWSHGFIILHKTFLWRKIKVLKVYRRNIYKQDIPYIKSFEIYSQVSGLACDQDFHTTTQKQNKIPSSV